LDDQVARRGTTFCFDLHLFDLRERALVSFVEAFAMLGREGIGTGRGHANLRSVYTLDYGRKKSTEVYDGAKLLPSLPPPLVLPLDIGVIPISRVRILFVTPTELKADEKIAAVPEFVVLFKRISSRLSTLRELYQEGPLPINFVEMDARASQIKITDINLAKKFADRPPTKTGQTHFLGGFVGKVEYSGGLTEFVPFLAAAYWTGVGRHTVWGKGVIQITELIS
jgi:hypothetical protein